MHVPFAFSTFMTFCKELPSTRLYTGDYRYQTIAGCVSLLLHILFFIAFFVTLPEEKKEHKAMPNAIPVEIAVMPAKVEEEHPVVEPVAEEEAPAQPDQVVPREVAASDTEGEQDHTQEEIAIPQMKRVSQIATGKTARKRYASVNTVSIPSIEQQNSAKFSNNKEASIAYTQKITLWFKNHKRYSALGNRQAMLRIHLNRSGKLVFSRLDQSTGDKVLDQQIIDTAKFASPFPAFPPGFSSSQEEAFLLPINTMQE